MSDSKNNVTISVIIPTLNEEDTIKSLLLYLKQLNNHLQLIVVDAGSKDKTVAAAQTLGTVIQSAPGRGIQMNKGSQVATGDILWFLHADCRPHPGSIMAIRKVLSDEKIIGGGFEYNLNHPGIRFRIVEFFSNRKNRRLKWLFGDMGIFVRREIFEKMGGYKNIPLMEDMDFCKRLKQYGSIVILPVRMNTSARRWTEEGYIFNMVRNWILQLAWALGVAPDTLARYYKFK